MKKIIVIAIGAIGGVFLAFIIIVACMSGCEARDHDRDHAFITESLNKANAAINEGDYTTAYTIADEMIAKGYKHVDIRDAGYDLNKKILTNEIAATIDSAEGSDAAMRLILIIKERAQYNDYWAAADGLGRGKDEERTMLELALQLSKAKGDEACAKQLQEVLNDYEDK